MQSNDQPPEFFDERRLCEILGISSVTATKWRAKAKGPPFIKVGRLDPDDSLDGSWPLRGS